jgi:hypothetical protein
MAIAYVQGTGINASGEVSSLAKAFASNVTGGNAIAVGISMEWDAEVINSVTDTRSNTYTSQIEYSLGTTDKVAIFGAVNISGGSCTVTVALANPAYLAIGIAEASGVATSSYGDGTKTATGTSTTPATGSFSTTDTDIIFGVVGYRAYTTVAVGSGWSLIYEYENYDNMTISFEYQIGASGSYNAQWTLGASAQWLCCAAAFKPAGGGASLSIPVVMNQYRQRRE